MVWMGWGLVRMEQILRAETPLNRRLGHDTVTAEMLGPTEYPALLCYLAC